jgi:hypothetical protein
MSKFGDLKKELRETTGYIELSINDLMEGGYLSPQFLDDITLDSSLYLHDMDEMKPRMNSLRADFRTTEKENALKSLLTDFGIDKLELDEQGVDSDWNIENGTIKYSINHSFKYYNGLHNELTEAILNLPDISIDQMWWFNSFQVDDPTAKQTKILYDTLVKIFYPEYKDVRYNSHHTFYNKGCGIDDHSDGINESSLFAALTYLNNRYEPSWGGRLRVGKEPNFKLIEPRFGKISMLDFIKHNPMHGVETVTDNNGRYAILSFVYNNQPLPI